jgi:CheY-like chemotaxis protein
MQCPRCRAPINTAPDPGGFLICPGCGARLTTRPARPPDPLAHNPNATLPPGTTIKVPRPGEDTAKSKGAPAEGMDTPSAPSGGGQVTLETVLAELRGLRRVHEEVLRLLRVQVGQSEEPMEIPTEDAPALLPPVRSRRRKSVLLIDDDDATRQASLAELQTADVPATGYADGRAALEAMAQDKPDVIAIELDVGGALPGKDIINIIKSTMEWVDIPIILYTRAPVESQLEARQVHGADDIVLKRTGPAALVSKVVALFRRP